jgi:hypothetical protein
VTALNTPIPIPARSQMRGSPVDDFVDRLSHPVPVSSANAIVAALQCVVSFGLLPLILWPTRWADFLESERQDLLDLTAWWRRRVAPADAAQLDNLARRFKPRPMLMVLPWLLVGFNVVLLGSLLLQGDSLNRLFELTFKHIPYSHSSAFVTGPNWHNPPADSWAQGNSVRFDRSAPDADPFPLENRLYSGWMISLCIGYFFHWYAVRSHTATVRSLVQWTNRIGRENRFVRVRNQAHRLGMDPLWVVLAVILASHGAWWGIPMTLAGAMQRRYLSKSSPEIRQALAEQARDAFSIVQSTGDRFCAAGHCGARLPAPAKFCPRCGTACGS